MLEEMVAQNSSKFDGTKSVGLRSSRNIKHKRLYHGTSQSNWVLNQLKKRKTLNQLQEKNTYHIHMDKDKHDNRFQQKLPSKVEYVAIKPQKAKQLST